MFAEFHFLRPWWLLAVVPTIIFLYWFARHSFAMRRWQDIVEPQLMPHVLVGAGSRKRRLATVWLTLAGALLILALAGPVWQSLPQPVFRSQDALVVALDLSRSMDVADMTPSRLARARFKINDLLTRRVEGQSALLVYAAEPYVISPLTEDTRTIISQLPALETGLMPSQGSRADRALAKAADLLNQAGVKNGHVVLVTDGLAGDEAAEVAGGLFAAGIRVSVLGVGTADGGPIPGPGGFVKQGNGSIVIARLDTAALTEVAASGGGIYRALAADDSDIRQLLAGSAIRDAETDATDREVDVWREEGPWLLLPLLPLVALAFRRGVLAVWLLVLILPPRPADALDWADLWSRPDQRAAQMLDAGDAEGAAQTFQDPAWKSAAAYRAGQYEESLAASAGLDDIESTYNRGNAMARLENYDEALAAYEDVLKRDPEHNDARYNRDLIRRQQQQQQQDQGSEGEPGESQDNQGQDNQDQDGESQQDPGQQQGEGQEQPSSPQQAGAESDSAETQQTEDAPSPEEAEQSASTDQESDQLSESADSPVDDDGKQVDTQAAADAGLPDEEAQKMEQWLRKIPDDPGGLLRRKFRYQYQQRDSGRAEEEQW